MKILRFSLEENQKCPENVNSFQLVLWHSWDSLLIPKISVKTVWIEPEMIPVDFAIRWTIRYLSFKTTQWMESTCSLRVEVFRQPNRGSSLEQSLLCIKSEADFVIVWEVEILCKYLYNVLIDFHGCLFFFCGYFLTARASVLSSFRCVTHLSLLYWSH